MIPHSSAAETAAIGRRGAPQGGMTQGITAEKGSASGTSWIFRISGNQAHGSMTNGYQPFQISAKRHRSAGKPLFKGLDA
jgi:hypothetical protein